MNKPWVISWFCPIVFIKHTDIHWLYSVAFGRIRLKEKKTQSKCMFRLVDDDIESPCKNFLDTFDFFV